MPKQTLLSTKSNTLIKNVGLKIKKKNNYLEINLHLTFSVVLNERTKETRLGANIWWHSFTSEKNLPERP